MLVGSSSSVANKSFERAPNWFLYPFKVSEIGGRGQRSDYFLQDRNLKTTSKQMGIFVFTKYMTLSYQYLSRFLYYDRGKPGKLKGILCSPSGAQVHTAQLKRIILLDFMQILPQKHLPFSSLITCT